MPRNGFRKAALATAIASIYGVTVSSISFAQSDINNEFTNSQEISGVASDAAIFVLQTYSGLNLFRSGCSKSGSPCTFTNTGAVNLGDAPSVIQVDDGAFYKIINEGMIDASGGTFITAGAGSGTTLSITNTGTIKAATIVNYAAPDSTLTVRLDDGLMVGDITAMDDGKIDSILLRGGGYSGTANNFELIRASRGASSIDGTLNFRGTAQVNNKLEVLSNAQLYTSSLQVNDSKILVNTGGVLSLGISDSNIGTGNSVIKLDTSNSYVADVENGTVAVVPVKGFTSLGSRVYLIDKVKTSNAANALEVSPLFVLSTPTATSGNELSVIISGSGTSAEDIIKNNGGSANAAKAFKLAESSSDSKLYRAVVSKVGLKNAIEFAEELAPTTNGGAIALAQDSQDISIQNVTNRLNAVSSGTGISSGSVLDGKTLWMQGLYGEGDQDDRDRSDGSTLRGYTSRITGFTMGMDVEMGHDLLAGAAVSIGQGSVNKNKVSDNTELDTYLATLYGRWYVDVNTNTNLDVFLSYGLHKNKRERFFDVDDAILNEATASFDSQQYGLKAILSRTVMMDEWAVTPLVGIHYGRFDIDGYKEKGSAAALEMDKQRYEIIEAGLGVGISRTFHYKDDEIIPELKVTGWHDFSSDPVEVQSRFVTGGDSFVATGLEPEKTTWSASAGVTFIEDEKFEMSTGYERSWRKGYNSDNIYFRAEYKF